MRLGVHGDGLTGRIAKAAYLGDHMEYQVAVDGMAKELFVIDTNVAAPRTTAGAFQVGIGLLDALQEPPWSCLDAARVLAAG